MTCEAYCTSAYHDDLRWRVVWQSEVLGLSFSQIANNLNISIWTVERVINIFSATGTVSKKPYPTGSAFRIINDPIKLYIFHLLLQNLGYCSVKSLRN